MLQGRVALVTGAAGALGSAVTEIFGREGAHLALAGRSRAALEGAARTVPSGRNSPLVLEMDAGDPESVRLGLAQVEERFGRLDILVHTVGGFEGGGSIDETPVETWDRMMALNARTAFISCRAAFPIMKRGGYGRIILVSARPAIAPTAGLSAYGASKAALLNLVGTLAAEGREHNVTANAVLPGTLDTAANRRDMPDADASRWTPPERVARVIAFLASEGGVDVSGAYLPVFGRS